MTAPRAVSGAGGFSLARCAWPLLFLALACAEAAPPSVAVAMRDGSIVQMNEDVLAEAIASGAVRDTTSVFLGDRWIPARDHPEVARLLRRESERRAATEWEREQARVLTINADSPGERVDLAAFRVPGKNVIFDFSSKHCGPCRKTSGMLEQLAARRPDVLIRVVDIDRPGAFGIDWGSPVAEQYALRSVPSLRLARPDGSILDEEKSEQIVYGWLYEAGLLR